MSTDKCKKFLNLATALYSLFTLRGVVPLLTNRDKKVIKEAAEKGKSRQGMATVTQGRLVYEGGRARPPRRPILHVLEKDSKGTRRQCLAGFLQGRSRHLAKLRSKKTVEPS